ncbi:hypothetical protein ACPA9J_16805 [Pseudomonas aeruginosa]
MNFDQVKLAQVRLPRRRHGAERRGASQAGHHPATAQGRSEHQPDRTSTGTPTTAATA